MAYPGDGQVGLSWNTPTQGSTLTNYVVNYRQHNTSTWSTFSHPTSTATSITVTGLTNDISYDFEVIGVNIAGAGLSSGILTATPTATSPATAVTVAPHITSTLAESNIAFTATVTNALDTSVTWSASLGTITPGGLYTAPSNTGNTALTDTITATSVEDPTKSATASVTVSSGLIGWWPLDEGTGSVVHDISGQGNNGAWHGKPTSPSDTYYAVGMIGPYAGYFDGSDNSVTVGSQPVYQLTGPFTISAWVNTFYNGTIISMQNGGDNGYNLGINYGGIRFCVYANTPLKVALPAKATR